LLQGKGFARLAGFYVFRTANLLRLPHRNGLNLRADLEFKSLQTANQAEVAEFLRYACSPDSFGEGVSADDVRGGS
jgi:hypothetical protein